MIDRISTFSQSQDLTANTLRLQSKYATTQMQVSSGQKSSDYQGIAAETPKLLSLESDYKKLVSQSETAQTALDRTQVIYDTLGSITNAGQSFLDDLNAAISDTGVDDSQLADMASQTLSQIVSLLNTQSTGRYLFSGSAVKTAPVDLSLYTGTSGITLPSVSDTSYYQGNDDTQSVDVRDGFSVEYGLTADNPAFEKLIRAFDLVVNSQSTSDPDAALGEAYTLLGDSLDSIQTLQAQTSQDSQTLNRFIDDNLTDLNLIDSMISDLKEVDLAEVSVKLQELEAQLEASYSVTTRLLNIKLSDYL